MSQAYLKLLIKEAKVAFGSKQLRSAEEKCLVSVIDFIVIFDIECGFDCLFGILSRKSSIMIHTAILRICYWALFTKRAIQKRYVDQKRCNKTLIHL